MKRNFLFPSLALALALALLAPTWAWSQSSNASANGQANGNGQSSGSSGAQPTTPPADSYSELVQTYIAKREALLQQRKATQEKLKAPNVTAAEKKKARDDQDAAEKAFHVQNADLIKNLRAAEAKLNSATKPTK